MAAKMGRSRRSCFAHPRRLKVKQRNGNAGAEVATADNLDDALCLLEAWQILRGTASI
jgi:hypothetical protein